MNSAKRIPLIGTMCLLGAMLAAGAAQAHNWGCWIQPNRTVYTWNTAALSSQASAALSEWDSKTVLALPRLSSHTDISVFDGFYGNTGWAGIASIESASGCNILHGHARVNRSYSYSSNGYRGIFCQEVGHLFGLDHSNDGGCMGGGYFYDINTYYTVVQHNINDIASKYSGVPASAERIESGLAASRSDEPALLGEPIPQGTTRAVAFWHERPQTLEDAARLAHAVVEARVLRVQPGADLVVPVEGLENGVDRIPTQHVLFVVERAIAGKLGSKLFEMVQTGNADFTIDESPVYNEGEKYVLFLTPGDRGTYRAIAPEGRLKVTAAGLEPTSRREFMSDLRGSSVESLADAVVRLASPVGQNPATAGLQLRSSAANPFTSRTSVSYSLPARSNVKLLVFDPQGRLVRTLVNATQEGPRWYTADWDGTDDRGQIAPNGVYFYRLQTQFGERSMTITRIK